MNWIDGQAYWLTYKDGSRIWVSVRVDWHGEVDLVNDALGFFIWAGGATNLDGFTWEEVR